VISEAASVGPLEADAELIVDAAAVDDLALGVEHDGRGRAPGIQQVGDLLVGVDEHGKIKRGFLSMQLNRFGGVLQATIDGEKLDALWGELVLQFDEPRQVHLDQRAFRAQEDNGDGGVVFVGVERHGPAVNIRQGEGNSVPGGPGGPFGEQQCHGRAPGQRQDARQRQESLHPWLLLCPARLPRAASVLWRPQTPGAKAASLFIVPPITQAVGG
jgi:hypothetical protein